MGKKKKKNKKKTKDKPVILKSRAEMTSAEYNALVRASENVIEKYLDSAADEKMSFKSRVMVKAVVAEELRYRMATDEVFFDRMNILVNRDGGKDTSGKCFEIVKDLYANGRIKERLAELFPEDYRLPENRGKKRGFFRTLAGSYR